MHNGKIKKVDKIISDYQINVMSKINMGLTGNLKLEQKQRLSPQMLISAELIQKPIQELEQALRRELSINPFLEDTLEYEDFSDELESSEDEELSQSEEGDLADKIQEVNEILNDMDNLQNGSWEYERADKSRANLEKYEGFEVEIEKFWENFREDAKEIATNNEEIEFIKGILNSIDHVGRLTTQLEYLISETSISMDRAIAIHKSIMSLYPRGIGARNLEECLIAQLEQIQLLDELLVSVIRNDIKLLENRKYKKIALKHRVPIERIKEINKIISQMDPRPGSRISTGTPSYIKPDIIVKKIDGDIRVFINETFIPEIRVNQHFARKLLNKSGGNADTIKYIKDKLLSAQNYVKALWMRQETLESIAHEIVRQQPTFFKDGIKTLHPMTYDDIAGKVNRDISTVCRVVKSKFVDTPNGVFPLKWFFTSSVSNNSSQAVKRLIEEIIKSEDKSMPYSDRIIRNKLEEQQIKISLRAVTKYRNMMGIPTSRLRRG
ncbi:MAG: RNA polymerase factor sigma-54 [Candidatus Cloacimonadota bacterium]|nr:RNA polymerase factor sigma-54 [Candidatus Cloacimonadota bacterium]